MKTSLGAKQPMLYPTPVMIVGTYDAAGRANAMNVAWGGICCSQPPCVNISVRKATYTYGNLLAKQAFTVNLPSEDNIVVADYMGLASGHSADKFAAAGLTAVQGEFIDAPYIEEFPFVLECKVVHVAELGLHTLFVGEIQDIKVEESCLDEEGRIINSEVKPVAWLPTDRKYYTPGRDLGKAFDIGKAILRG